MDQILVRKYDMLRRVQQFLNARAAPLAAVNRTAARRELDRLVADMAASEAAEVTTALNRKEHTATQAMLRRRLWSHHMVPIATIAAAHLHDVPGFEAFKLPPTTPKVSLMVHKATAMANAARPYQQVFVENGQPEDFADQLLAAIARVRQSIDARAATITRYAGARGGLRAMATRMRLVVRVLDAQVSTALEDDADGLAAWKSAKRIGGRTAPKDGASKELATPKAVEQRAIAA